MATSRVDLLRAKLTFSRAVHTVRDYVGTLGPGLITGASDDDPSCLGTFAQTGAQFGYLQLWTALFAYPLMGVIQEMCARIGLQTGEGLAANIRDHYPRPVLYLAVTLISLASTITLGADLGAMAAAAQLVLGIPFVVWLVAIPLISIGLEIFTRYGRVVRMLRILALTLLAYVVVAFLIPQNWHVVLNSTLIPTLEFNQNFLMNLVAIFGSAVSPYLYFWQMSLEVEGKIEQGDVSERITRGVVDRIALRGVSRERVARMRLDVFTGMLFSGLVAWSVLVTIASTLHRNGITNVASAAAAAQALRPMAGNFSYLLFAVGIVGAGMLALPVLAGSVAYAVTGAFELKAGFSKRLLNAPGFYGVIILSMVVGAAINLVGINPIQALYYAAVVNGLAAPPLLIMIMRLGSNREIMADHVNGPLSKLLGWTTTATMTLAAVALIVNLLATIVIMR